MFESSEVELLNEDDFTSMGRQLPRTEKVEEDHSLHLVSCDPPGHIFLFGSEFVTVDTIGNVLILSVPALPFVKLSEGVNVCAQSTKEEIFSSGGPADNNALSMKLESTDQGFLVHQLGEIPLDKVGSRDMDEEHDGPRDLSQSSPRQKENDALHDRGKDNITTPDASKLRVPQLQARHDEDQVDVDMSPRLSSYMKCGIVPESPVNGIRTDFSCNHDSFQWISLVSH